MKPYFCVSSDVLARISFCKHQIQQLKTKENKMELHQNLRTKDGLSVISRLMTNSWLAQLSPWAHLNKKLV